MIDLTPLLRTRVVSLNTDSVLVQVQPGDETAVSQVIADWERTFNFQMERTEVLAHRGVNVNSYIEIIQEEGKKPEIKSKGLLAHDPGITADHDRIIVAQAVGQWLLDSTDYEQFIRDAAARREILKFTEMRSAPSSGLRVGGKPIGRIARVYRSTRKNLPTITKDATGSAKEQTLEGGFAYLPDTTWPAEDDLDVDWYILQARLLIAKTDTPYSPHHNRIARDLENLGLQVFGVGGAATTLADNNIDFDAIARGTEKNPRNYSGDRALAVSLAKSTGVLMIAAGHASADSLVLVIGGDAAQWEIHDRLRLQQTATPLSALRKAKVSVIEKGHVVVYDPGANIKPLAVGQPVAIVTATIPAEFSAEDNSSSLITNDQFLQHMFGSHLNDAFVCSNLTPPDTDDEMAKKAMWAGGPIEFSKNLYQSESRQNYTCVSSFSRDEDDVYRRQMEHFNALHFVVLDDIGTKVTVDPRALGFGEPTYINETSPGNCQWFYKLREPVTDLSVASFLMKTILAMPVQGVLMTDQGAKGVTRLCKLPRGMNLKLALGAPWQNRQISWRPDLSYTPEEIAGWFGADLKDAPKINANPAAASEDSAQHPLILALQSAGLLKSASQKNSGWWDIRCVQANQHTNGDESGTAVKIRNDGSWTFRCLHGHCADFTPRDLYCWLSEQGYEVAPPQAKTNIKRIDRGQINFLGKPQIELDEFAFMDPDDGSAGEEVIFPDPELAGGGAGSVGSGGSGGGSAKPVIHIDPGLLPSILLKCSNLLSDMVFKRGVHLVRIGKSSELVDGLSRLAARPVLLSVTRYWMLRELTERATFMRWNMRLDDYKIVDCPMNIAAALETGTDDQTFRPLTTMTLVPFLRADGSVCTTPGYDHDTGIYYAPAMNFPPISSAPSWHDARRALDELAELVTQFPFANAVSRSVFLADVLTAIARPTLPKSPAVLYTATMAGSGKTLMASIANLIAYGDDTNHPWPRDNEEELKKVFTSVLIAGDPVVVFDNLPNGARIDSAALSQFLTSDAYADRILGESERVKIRNRTRVVLTGNNVTLASDNARRTLVCELQLQVESLKDRHVIFEHPNLPVYIKQNRPRLIAAALTVLRGYAIHPTSLSLPPLDSFEEWSWRVRDALVWLGEEDPVVAVKYENDGSGEVSAAFTAIKSMRLLKQHERSGEAFVARDLAGWASGNAELRDALENAGCAEPNNASKVGYWLRAHKNRIAGGLKLTCQIVDGGREPNKWSLSNSDVQTHV
jgi:hypothetical protein